MRRCPACFAVYDDHTTRCKLCDVATEGHGEVRTGNAAPAGPSAPEELAPPPGEESSASEESPDGEMLLAEADAEWIGRAAEALARAGIPAHPVAAESHPEIVALYVPAREHARAIDVVGEALDEPPALILEPPPGETVEEAPEEAAAEEPEPPPPEPPAGPPEAPDPDQAAFCPDCGEAYRAGFERCADCGIPLVPMGAGKPS